MKKMIKSILMLAILMFASISLFNCAYAQNEVTTTGNTTSPISAQNTAANQTNQTNTQITTTVSSTSSADDGFLSPTNIINN